MKKRILEQEFFLSESDIDRLSEMVEAYLTENKIDRKEMLRLRFSLEEVLLNWKQVLGQKTKVRLSMFPRLGKYYVELQCKGESCNPFEKEDEVGAWAKSLRSSLQSVPTYDYIKGINTVYFQASKPHMSRLLLTLICLLVGIGIGFAGYLLPEAFRQSVSEKVFNPLYTTYLNVFSFCGIPLIFLSVLTGILGVGNIHSFALLGRKMVKRFLLTTAIAILVTLGIGLLVFKLDFSGSSVTIQYSSFLDMILGWIPTGVFQPFINQSAMQLIIMGIGTAIAILILGRSDHLSGFMFDANALMVQISKWLSALIPIFVCISLVNAMWQHGAGTLLSAWKSWVATTSVQALMILVLMLSISRKHKVGIGQLIKKVSNTFFAALGTNSCAASIPANVDDCVNNLGIQSKVFSFGIPVGTTIFKPATAIRLVFLCLFMVTGDNHIAISPSWLVMLCIMAFVLSIATPAIPGGTLMLCSMLFTQLQIPTEVLTQMLTTDFFFDCVCTAFNQIAVSLSLTGFATDTGMINKEKLLAKNEQE